MGDLSDRMSGCYGETDCQPVKVPRKAGTRSADTPPEATERGPYDESTGLAWVQVQDYGRKFHPRYHAMIRIKKRKLESATMSNSVDEAMDNGLITYRKELADELTAVNEIITRRALKRYKDGVRKSEKGPNRAKK